MTNLHIQDKQLTAGSKYLTPLSPHYNPKFSPLYSVITPIHCTQSVSSPMLSYLQLAVVQLSPLGCNKLLAPISVRLLAIVFESIRMNQWMSSAISYCTRITPIAIVVQLSPFCCNKQLTPITDILGNT